MRANEMKAFLVAAFSLVGFIWPVGAQSALTALTLQGSQEVFQPEVNVFFGTSKALNVLEIKTNALELLAAKKYIVPETSKCVINIQIGAKSDTCAVLFWDLEAKMRYQVVFDSKGKPLKVIGGHVQHGTPSPTSPRPKKPTGGVKVTP